MVPRILLAILAGLVAAPSVRAQLTTSDVVDITGGSSSVKLAEHHSTKGAASFVQLGVIMWTVRDANAVPVPVTVMSRGLQEVLFFEPAPLLDVALPTVDALRSQLQL